MNTITNEEYNKLIGNLAFFDTTRNTLLTFSFTTVLAALGVAIGSSNDLVATYIPILAYFLIVPFSARISYYRLASAHISSFLKVFAPDKTQFARGTVAVPEKHNMMYGFIAKLINYEMLILSLVPILSFLFQHIVKSVDWRWYDSVIIVFSLLSIICIFSILISAFNYGKMSRMYMNKWVEYKSNLNMNTDISS